MDLSSQLCLALALSSVLVSEATRVYVASSLEGGVDGIKEQCPPGYYVKNFMTKSNPAGSKDKEGITGNTQTIHVKSEDFHYFW